MHKLIVPNYYMYSIISLVPQATPSFSLFACKQRKAGSGLGTRLFYHHNCYLFKNSFNLMIFVLLKEKCSSRECM